MSRHIGQQLGYNQAELPAAFSFKPQVIRGKQDTYRQAVQAVFRYREAKLLEVPRSIGQAPPFRHVQRPMNVGALMQEVYNVEERGLDRHAIRPHSLG
jgi:hypothetical protein